MTTAITTIEKNRNEELRISLKEYMGHHCFDIRVFCDPNHDEGQGRIPTKKGVTMAVTKLPDLVAALQQAVSEARAAGLLPNRARHVADASLWGSP